MGFLDSLMNRLSLAKAKPKSTPIIGFRNTAQIPVNGSFMWDFETDVKSKDFYPFTNVKVLNNDTANIIEVYINGNTTDYFTVLNRAMEPYVGEVRTLTVVNRGSATIAVDAIVINLWNE